MTISEGHIFSENTTNFRNVNLGLLYDMRAGCAVHSYTHNRQILRSLSSNKIDFCQESKVGDFIGRCKFPRLHIANVLIAGQIRSKITDPGISSYQRWSYWSTPPILRKPDVQYRNRLERVRPWIFLTGIVKRFHLSFPISRR
jgi:hypothetical protein